ncbi:MAG: thioredoxin family protein [Candidatus Scalinduaceae bacterium]
MRKRLVTCLGITIMVLFCVRAEAIEWETDFEKALSAARTSGKYILLDFSGSDWCGWCMKLEKEVFNKDDFKNFAREHLVCVLVDFPRQKKQSKKLKQQNWELAKKYGIRGYPTVIMLSPEGELVGKTGYLQGGPRMYAQHLKEIIVKHKAKQ